MLVGLRSSEPGLVNGSAEVDAAGEYAARIRVLVVGMDASCSGTRVANSTRCAQQLDRLDERAPLADGASCTLSSKSSWIKRQQGAPCRLPWSRATPHVVSGLVSAVCYLTAKRVAAALGPSVPLGLVCASYGATPIQAWMPRASLRECAPRAAGSLQPSVSGALYNAMVHPLTLGPMALRAVLYYHGEGSVGGARYYACAFPSLIRHWRLAFHHQPQPALWWAFVQIAGFRYSGGVATAAAEQRAHGGGANASSEPPHAELSAERGGTRLQADVEVSGAVGALRQAQLSALSLPRVLVASAIDVGHVPSHGSGRARHAPTRACSDANGLCCRGARARGVA